MMGRSLIRAIASMTVWLKSFGTVLTPMIPVGRIDFDGGQEALQRRVGMGERLLEVGQVGAAALDQAVDVDQPAALAGLVRSTGRLSSWPG